MKHVKSYSFIVVALSLFIFSCGSSDSAQKTNDNKNTSKKNGSSLRTDSDGDGVPDYLDRCPDVPGPKENNGCPIVDRDGDGIADDKDKCPDEPETYNGYMDDDGCPDVVPVHEEKKEEPKLVIDTTHVVKAVTDPVPVPTAPILVNPDPTPIKPAKITQVKENRIVLKLEFPQGTVTMKRPQVDALIELVKNYKTSGSKGTITMDLYNWETGNAAKDMKLAEKRANIISKFLMQNKIPGDQIKINLHNEAAPESAKSKQFYDVRIGN